LHIRKTELQRGGGQAMSGRQTVVTPAMPDENDPIIDPFRKEMRFQPIEKGAQNGVPSLADLWC
jgi:hypothetical protein